MTGFAINPPNAPLGSANGVPVMLDPAWYKFFLEIQRRLGGPGNPFDDAVFLASNREAAEPASEPELSAIRFVPTEVPDPLIPPVIALPADSDPLNPYGLQLIAKIKAGEPVTRVNDTNVTLTLGGMPESGAVNAFSLTLGWSGTLAIARGGTGASTAADARTNFGLGTADSPQFAGVNVGHATDTTVTRTGAGDIAVEGNLIYRAGGTDVPVADGGTGASNASDARTNLGLGTAAVKNTGTSGDAVPVLNGAATTWTNGLTAPSFSVVDSTYQLYVSGSSAILQFDGSSDAFIYNRSTNTLSFFIGGTASYQSSATFFNIVSGAVYQLGGTQILTSRRTGWGAATGTATRTAIATYTAPTISSPPTQAEVQDIANALQAWSRRDKALSDDLTTHGLIGA